MEGGMTDWSNWQTADDDWIVWRFYNWHWLYRDGILRAAKNTPVRRSFLGPDFDCRLDQVIKNRDMQSEIVIATLNNIVFRDLWRKKKGLTSQPSKVWRPTGVKYTWLISARKTSKISTSKFLRSENLSVSNEVAVSSILPTEGSYYCFRLRLQIRWNTTFAPQLQLSGAAGSGHQRRPNG